MMHKLIALSASLACFLFIAGCGSGPPLGTVQGTVKLDDKPIPGARIIFESVPPGYTAAAEIGEDESYSVKSPDGTGLPEGKYKVAFLPPMNPVPTVIDPNPKAKAPKAAGADFNIPARYRSLESSGFDITVKHGENPPFDYDLKS